tara:strand:- start:3167 stop:3706 length:540 start_codon:yes stop_codon:yes gene_type:complete
MDLNDYAHGLLPLYFIESAYESYKNFLKCFDMDSESHRDSGDSTTFYLQNYEYPAIVDNEYINFVKKHVANLPYENVQHSKSWWVEYPAHSYAGMHSHTPGRQFTCVLFLDDYIEDEQHPHAGYLYAVLNNENKMTYQEWKPEAGKLIILDGRVWHGTYPTRQRRRVFVTDFTFDVGEF